MESFQVVAIQENNSKSEVKSLQEEVVEVIYFNNSNEVVLDQYIEVEEEYYEDDIMELLESNDEYEDYFEI